jgi:hypothetical protein
MGATDTVRGVEDALVPNRAGLRLASPPREHATWILFGRTEAAKCQHPGGEQ